MQLQTFIAVIHARFTVVNVYNNEKIKSPTI